MLFPAGLLHRQLLMGSCICLFPWRVGDGEGLTSCLTPLCCACGCSPPQDLKRSLQPCLQPSFRKMSTARAKKPRRTVSAFIYAFLPLLKIFSLSIPWVTSTASFFACISPVTARLSKLPRLFPAHRMLKSPVPRLAAQSPRTNSAQGTAWGLQPPSPGSRLSVGTTCCSLP